MIQFKPEVKLVFTPAIGHLLYNLSRVSEHFKVDLVVTSGNDSNHMEGSKHYKNEAIDVRSKHFDKELKNDILELLKAKLGPRFFVDLEYEGSPNEHYHLQVRRGTTFP